MYWSKVYLMCMNTFKKVTTKDSSINNSLKKKSTIPQSQLSIVKLVLNKFGSRNNLYSLLH